MTDNMKKSAVISDCGNYRYELTRSWGDKTPYVLFIGLNPSIADAKIDDPTMRRCIDFAKQWGFESLKMANLFAYRATDPSAMKSSAMPVGELNDYKIASLARDATLIVACWGNDGLFLGRDKQVFDMLNPYKAKIDCFGLTKIGQPKHPLYLPKNTPLKNLHMSLAGTI